MATGKAHINKKMLTWARKEAGLSLDAAAVAAKISDARGRTGAERIEAWEGENDELPTKNQLEYLAKAYVQPPIVFYLPSPPVDPDPLPDFRKLTPGDPGLSPHLKALVAKMKGRQQEIIDILLASTDDDLPPLPFVGKFTVDHPVDVVVESLREDLGVSEPDQRKLKDADTLFKLLRSRAEDLGIFVVLEGDLGSHHTRIEPEEFRGFCLPDLIAPFVVLNRHDHKSARGFTLLHELAHLLINEGGISNARAYGDDASDSKIEAFCNKVASQFLLPPASLHKAWAWQAEHNQDIFQAVEAIAQDFCASRRAVAYNLRMAQVIEFTEWRKLDAAYEKAWKENKAKAKAKQGTTIISPFRNKKSWLGARLINTVLGALDEGMIGYSSASRILDVTTKGFGKIRSQVA